MVVRVASDCSYGDCTSCWLQKMVPRFFLYVVALYNLVYYMCLMFSLCISVITNALEQDYISNGNNSGSSRGILNSDNSDGSNSSNSSSS